MQRKSHRPVAAQIVLLLSVAHLSSLGGCSKLQVSTLSESRAVSLHGGVDARITSLLAAGMDPKRNERMRIKSFVQAAQFSIGRAAEGNESALAAYNSAVTGVVGILITNRFETRGELSIRRQGSRVIDPSTADSLIKADLVTIRGLAKRSLQKGLGVAYSAGFRFGSPVLSDQPGIPPMGIEVPVTAVVTFPPEGPQLAFHRTLLEDSIRVGNRDVRLAADFSAPLSLMVARGRNRAIDIGALLRSDRNMSRAGLFQFQIYEPNKIPVVFVHGLLSRPEAWIPAANTLLADREIRDRYQFWFFLYPTGLPVWQSAAFLRSELDRFRADLRTPASNLDRMVVIGHSMGGLLSSLLIRQGGEKLWRQFSDKSPTRLSLSPESRRLLAEMVYFEPRSDVDRVIFIATPHRGSGLAVNPAVSLVTGIVRLPFKLQREERGELLMAMREDARQAFTAPINSIRFLRANSPLLLSTLELPVHPSVRYHSIIGDRGRGNTPRSSDGVVPYWSSHLPSAHSEKIVPSGHGANEHPDAIAEIRRILLESQN